MAMQAAIAALQASSGGPPAGEPASYSRTADPLLEAPSFLVQEKIVEQRRECRVVDVFDVEKSLGAHLSIPDRHQRDEPPREYARRDTSAGRLATAASPLRRDRRFATVRASCRR